MIFENLKKKLMHLQMLCGGLPTNKFEKDWPTLLLDCFAWFSHRQALNNSTSNANDMHVTQDFNSFGEIV